MGLQSKLFKGDPVFEACLVKDSAHIAPGSKGPHVSKIHTALFALDKFSPKGNELTNALYGPSTANGVLAYKSKRSIINHAYQNRADNIVGKMTIAAMDAEMFRHELSVRPPTAPNTFAWTTQRK